ncbi:MAG TPA: histidine kinase [Thiobacillaceae bacterium]|nr:histidine kinase [Thiobacillaceae bacterium]HNU63454.1 histidine kinase [Thiobacillaceae bacterium]
MPVGQGLSGWFERSMVARLGGAIAAIALLAVVGMSVSSMVALSTQGSGKAINLAGSLRMQSWHLASLYLSRSQRGPTQQGQLMRAAVEKFESTLRSAAIRAMLPGGREAHLEDSYRQVTQAWQQDMRPLFLGHASPATDGSPETVLRRVSGFVAGIDHLVKQMEDATEAKILVMQMVLGVALVITVLVVLLTVHLIHQGLVKPLQELLAGAARMGGGDLTVRSTHTGEDELGRLGQAFNLMAEDLRKLYLNLEERVAVKTEELTRSNRALELLYHSIARLHGSHPGRETYMAVLRDIEHVLGMGRGIVCLGGPGGHAGRVIATTLLASDANPCDKADCGWCHGTDTPRARITEEGRQLLTFPLADTEHQYGVLIVDAHAGHHVEAWQVQLLEALSRHIGVAIGAERRIEQNRRLALLEERAVIARELHDSLAQSLAYMRIQVSRLQAVINKPERQTEAEDMLQELREGMSGAYRQLRELLSTFRLRMEGEDLASALAQTVAEFADRGELEIDLRADRGGCVLSPNEEIHVLHVVREALSNVLNHARARHAGVQLVCTDAGRLEVTVEDDGIGIVKSANVHHYGMTIMEERARSLGGEIRYAPRPGGGTRVVLSFRPSRMQPILLQHRTAS